ncbi:unnamed protein product, partial [Polarella glacialis]
MVVKSAPQSLSGEKREAKGSASGAVRPPTTPCRSLTSMLNSFPDRAGAASSSSAKPIAPKPVAAAAALGEDRAEDLLALRPPSAAACSAEEKPKLRRLRPAESRPTASAEVQPASTTSGSTSPANGCPKTTKTARQLKCQRQDESQAVLSPNVQRLLRSAGSAGGAKDLVTSARAMGAMCQIVAAAEFVAATRADGL